MIYAYRTILVRRPVNRFGRLGYAERREWLKVDTEKKFEEANYRLKVRFTKLEKGVTNQSDIIREMRKQPVNSIRYSEMNEHWSDTGVLYDTWKRSDVKR